MPAELWMLIVPSVQILALKNNPPRHPTVCQRTWAQKPWVQVVEHSDLRRWRHCDHPQQVILFITKDWPGCEPGIYFATFYLLLARPFTTWLLRPPHGYYLNLKAPLSLFVSIFIFFLNITLLLIRFYLHCLLPFLSSISSSRCPNDQLIDWKKKES